MAGEAQLGVTAEFLESLTVEDIETIEDITGMSVDDLFSGKTEVKKGKVMRALGFVLMRQTDPDYTIEQAGKLSLVSIWKLLADAEVTAEVPLPDGNA